MREIKFRAWNKQTRRMEDVRQINFFDSEMLNGNSEWYSLRHIELLQHTGLNDKNGKEIYEGDIIQVDGYGNKEIYTVSYRYGRYVLEAKDLVEGFLDVDDDFLEVVGNIYENPKLLENEK